MAFAPNDEQVTGSFREKEHDNLFEFSDNEDMGEFSVYDYPHKIWVTTPKDRIDSGFRYGLVKKTVAYIVTDVDDEEKPIVEKWSIKNLREYSS